MDYLTREYYTNIFNGRPIPDEQFSRLVMIASDVIDAVVMRPVSKGIDMCELAKATAYQVEYLFVQGGIDAIAGMAADQTTVTEKLDDYSITEGLSDTAEKSKLSINGIPLSPLTISILRKLGLMHRWVYAGRCRRGI